ncbi:MAG: hypothetical protein QM813_08815 [Verrucomicrobiota bacterium]
MHSNGVWVFYNAREYHSDPATNAAPVPVLVGARNRSRPDLTETPEEIRSEVIISQRASLKRRHHAEIPVNEIRTYLSLHPDLPAATGKLASHAAAQSIGRAVEMSGGRFDCAPVRGRFRAAQCFCRGGGQHPDLLRLFCAAGGEPGGWDGGADASVVGRVAAEHHFYDDCHLVDQSRAVSRFVS